MKKIMKYIIITIFVLGNIVAFSQEYKTKYDTVDCSKYSCSQFGIINSNCYEWSNEQKPPLCASCKQLSLFLENKHDELDLSIYYDVLDCTIKKLECEFSHEFGFVPTLNNTYVYKETISSFQNKTYEQSNSDYTYEITEGWHNNKYLYSKIIVKRSGDYGYAKIGSGKCGIKQEVDFINPVKDDRIEVITVAVSGNDKPIITAEMIINKFYSTLKNNYELAKEYIYNQLRKVSVDWTQEDKQNAIRSIKWNYSDSRMPERKCEEKYFSDIKISFNENREKTSPEETVEAVQPLMKDSAKNHESNKSGNSGKEKKSSIKKHRSYKKFDKPLTTARMYHPDSIIKSGRWGNAVNIRETKSFDKFKTDYMEPGVVWVNGMFATPGNAPTEMIYYHDGSDKTLSGYVCILDCIDYCGSIGDCGFIIKGDGKELWNSGVVRHHDVPVSFEVSLSGVKELRLITNSGGDNVDEDWGAWLEMKVSKNGKKSKNKTKTKDDNKNMLVNGSFEEGFAPGTFKTLKAGDKIPGWTVTKGTVDLTGSYFKCADGKNSIDLNGTPGFGGIQQRFFTEKGKKYLLSFYFAGNPEGGPTIKKLLVSFGDQTEELQFDITGKTRTNMAWEYKELVFKAKDRATVLKFESNHKAGPLNWGPVIDNVKLVPYSKSKHHDIINEKSTSLFGFQYGILAGASYYFIFDDDIKRLMNYNNVLYDLKAEGDNIGIHIGFMTQMRIWRIFLRPEIAFNYNEINFNVNNKSGSRKDTIVKERYEYLDIPVLLGYKHHNFKFMAGPVWHVFVANQSGLKDIGGFSYDFKRLTIGLQTGFGFDFSKLGFDFRYECNCRQLGSGLEYSGKRIYFFETPGRVKVSLTYIIN